MTSYDIHEKTSMLCQDGDCDGDDDEDNDDDIWGWVKTLLPSEPQNSW